MKDRGKNVRKSAVYAGKVQSKAFFHFEAIFDKDISSAAISGERLLLIRTPFMTVHKENLIWIDLEMTGLDTENDVIIEIATIVTNSQLEIVAEGPVFAIHQEDKVLQAMDSWNTKQHGKSGLTERVQKSQVMEAHAEIETINFLKKYVDAGVSPMCGNSICQDRRFLAKHMPTLEAFFHYRHIDVSTIKELASRWRPDFKGGYSKNNTHLALDDIRESIEELKYYKSHWLTHAH